MDDVGKSHFVLEVEDLSHRISILRNTITSLYQSLDLKQTEIVKNNNIIEDAKNVLSNSENALAAKTATEEELVAQPELAIEQIENLRVQLTMLGRAESNLTWTRPERMDTSTALVPYTNNDEVVDTLQLWQSVFENTLQKYHNLSSLIASQKSKEIALKIWENHLDQVSSSLSTPLSESYNEIGEQISVGVLHRTLLMQNQQQLMVREPSEEAQLVQKLTTRNQELLDQIDNRNQVLTNRQMLWEGFTLDQDKLASWLREMEKEKQSLNLKHVALLRLPKLLSKIKQLLDRTPQGENLLRQLVSAQSKLQSNFNPSIMSSVRSEIHSFQVRKIQT